jgi:hypothetical protein
MAMPFPRLCEPPHRRFGALSLRDIQCDGVLVPRRVSTRRLDKRIVLHRSSRRRGENNKGSVPVRLERCSSRAGTRHPIPFRSVVVLGARLITIDRRRVQEIQGFDRRFHATPRDGVSTSQASAERPLRRHHHRSLASRSPQASGRASSPDPPDRRRHPHRYRDRQRRRQDWIRGSSGRPRR